MVMHKSFGRKIKKELRNSVGDFYGSRKGDIEFFCINIGKLIARRYDLWGILLLLTKCYAEIKRDNIFLNRLYEN